MGQLGQMSAKSVGRVSSASSLDTLGDERQRHSQRVVKRQRCKGGSARYKAAAAHLPPGPCSVEELGKWPEQIWADIFGPSHMHHELRRRRLEHVLQRGEVMHTDFSGRGGPEFCRRIIEQLRMDSSDLQLGGRRSLQGQLVFWRAADIDPLCRSLLLACEGNSPVHVFQDLCLRLPQAHRQKVVELQPGPEAGLQEARCAYKKISKYLEEHGADACGRHIRSASCVIHPGKACPVSFQDPPSDQPRPLTTLVAGPMCTATSQFGSREGLGRCTQQHVEPQCLPGGRCAVRVRFDYNREQ